VPGEGFLYRRLARVAPCALVGVAGGSILLRNKWQVSSLRDVFLSAHYWRLFDLLDDPPQLVVDLGAHCGHFVVLSELIAEERFGHSAAQYILFEGLTEMVENIRATLRDTGLTGRCEVVHGLVGLRSGKAHLRGRPTNMLESSAVSGIGAVRGEEVSYIDLLTRLPEGQMIDILKVDIEGSEYDLVENYPHLLERARVVAMEIHPVPGRSVDRMLQSLESAGLRPCLPHIQKKPNLLVLFKRDAPA
jgi:FkbM family methyltransferase